MEYTHTINETFPILIKPLEDLLYLHLTIFLLSEIFILVFYNYLYYTL